MRIVSNNQRVAINIQSCSDYEYLVTCMYMLLTQTDSSIAVRQKISHELI